MIRKLETYGRLLVVFDREYSLSEFRIASQVVPGSYADELVERIYNWLFKHTGNLAIEYKKYYSVEYSSLLDFLYWKHKIYDKILEDIKDRVKNEVYVGYTGDSIGIFEDETVIAVLNHLLGKLGETGIDLGDNDYDLDDGEWSLDNDY